jgi:hypothetical protein
MIGFFQKKIFLREKEKERERKRNNKNKNKKEIIKGDNNDVFFRGCCLLYTTI